jgi:hypothetical protein
LFGVGAWPLIRKMLEKEIGRPSGRPRKKGVPEEK